MVVVVVASFPGSRSYDQDSRCHGSQRCKVGEANVLVAAHREGANTGWGDQYGSEKMLRRAVCHRSLTNLSDKRAAGRRVGEVERDRGREGGLTRSPFFSSLLEIKGQMK